MPTPTTETSIVLNAHRVPPQHKGRRPVNQGPSVFFFSRKENEIKKAEIKCKKENKLNKKIKTVYNKSENEFTLKEYPGRADLPSPHYSPDGQNARGMFSGVGH